MLFITEALVEENAPPTYPGLYRSSSMEMLTSVEDFTDVAAAPPPAYAKAVVMATSSVDSSRSPLDRRVEQFKQAQVSLSSINNLIVPCKVYCTL